MTGGGYAEQREALFVAAQSLAHPGCLFIAPYKAEGDGDDMSEAQAPALLFESGKFSVTETHLADAKKQGADRDCLLLYHGLDCHLVDFDCQAPEGKLIESEAFVERRLSHEQEYGFINNEIQLKLFRIK